MAIKQFYYGIYINGGYQSNGDFENGFNNLKANKIGIQAPAGTEFELNGNKMVIGRTGVYQFEDDELSIKSIKFPNPVYGIIVDIQEG